MLNKTNFPKYFWVQEVRIACYVMNNVLIRHILKLVPNEIYKRNPNISHHHFFICKCFIINNRKDNLGKFDDKVDEGLFLGYFHYSKTFRIYNKTTIC